MPFSVRGPPVWDQILEIGLESSLSCRVQRVLSDVGASRFEVGVSGNGWYVEV